MRARVDRAGLAQEDVGPRIDPDWHAAHCRAGGSEPLGLLCGCEERGAVSPVLQVHPGRPCPHDGRHGGCDSIGRVPVSGFDVGGHRNRDRVSDPRDHRRGVVGVQPARVGYTQRPRDPGTGRGNGARSGSLDRHRRGDIPGIGWQQWISRLVRAGEDLGAMHRHDNHLPS
ncbi:MAG TPA: hypothetical protein VGH53_08150 [Streptosporangiaceae bacterium]|jgi:hypothetical protein